MVIIVLCATWTGIAPARRAGTSPVERETGSTSQRAIIDLRDESRAYGIPQKETPTWGAVWLDHDRDGSPELLVNRHKRFAWFMSVRRNGDYGADGQAMFRELPKGRKYYDRHGCAWGEANGDGRPDLYCVAGAQKGLGSGPNTLLLQRGEGFSERARRFGIVDLLGRGRTVNWLDHDGDGDLDIFVGNEYRPGHPNRMYRNDRGRFIRVDVGLTAELATFGSSWADVDGDADPDLVVLTHGHEGAIYYENDGGRFRIRHLPRVSGRRWSSAAFADFDGDGWIDLHLVSRWRSLVLRNDRGDLRRDHSMSLRTGRMSSWFDAENDGDLDLAIVQGRPKKSEWGTANERDLLLIQGRDGFGPRRDGRVGGPVGGSADAVVAADFDRDGREDLLVTNGYLDAWGRVQLFRNHTDGGGSVGLTLIGDRWNPLGFGTRVRVATDARTYHRQVTDGFNFKAQSDAGHLVLGVGTSPLARIRITWPDGGRDCAVAPAGTQLRVEKGSSPCS